jgi:hypothetical protein
MWQSRQVTPRPGARLPTIHDWSEDAEGGGRALAIVGGVELLLRERRHEQAEAVELHRGDQVLEQPVEVVDRDHLAPRHVAQLGAALQEDCGRKLGQERHGQVEVDVEPLEPGKHLDLHRWEHHAAARVLGMR